MDACRTITLEIDFEDDLEDPVATVTELGRRIRPEMLNLRSTKVRPMFVRGSLGEYSFSFSMLQEEGRRSAW